MTTCGLSSSLVLSTMTYETGLPPPPTPPPLPCQASSLHDHTPPTAASRTRVLLSRLRLTSLTGPAGVGGRIHLLVVPTDLPDDLVEGIIDVDARLGRGLDELAPEPTCQGFTLWKMISASALGTSSVKRIALDIIDIKCRKNWTTYPAWPPDARPRDRTCCRRQSWGSSPCP